MPRYTFRCENEGCLLNLPEGDERVSRVQAALGHSAGQPTLPGGEVEVSYPSYAAMRSAEASGEPCCSICKGSLVRRPSVPGIGTTRSTTPAKKKLDCAVGESADRQWASVLDDRARFGGDSASADRIDRFKKEDAAAKEQAADMVRQRKLVPRGRGGVA